MLIWLWSKSIPTKWNTKCKIKSFRWNKLLRQFFTRQAIGILPTAEWGQQLVLQIKFSCQVISIYKSFFAKHRFLSKPVMMTMAISDAGPPPPVGSTVCNHSSAPTNRQATQLESKRHFVGKKTWKFWPSRSEGGNLDILIAQGKMDNWIVSSLTSGEPFGRQTNPFNIKTSGKPKWKLICCIKS